MSLVLKYINEGLANIGLSIEPAVAILIFFVALIFTTKDLRLGLLVGILLYGLALIVAYSLGLNTLYFVIGVLLSFALLTLSLLIRKSSMGVY